MANDPVWTRPSDGQVESPCIKQCVIHPETGLCLGCKRNLDEIAAWGQMSDAARAEVMRSLADRQAAPRTRREGRKAHQHRAAKDI